ncbi:MAG: fasciclin domain-containing protein [Chitinophagaceae bacterium]
MTRKSLYPFLFLLTVAVFAASCKKSVDVTPTIASVVTTTSEFSILSSAVNKAGLGTTLGSEGPFTVFAPNNEAFAAAGLTASTVSGLSATDLTKILLYHTLPAKVVSTDVPAGPNAKVITASGDSIFVTRNAGGVFINGIKVTQADIPASNGVIHKLTTGVLLPPAGNIVNTAVAAKLDSLVKAVIYASTAQGGDPSLPATLSNATLTVFAPTNEAFSALLTALNLKSISQIPVATLLAVLRYHVVGGRAFSSDLTNGNLTMLAGGTTTINLTNGSTGGPTITGSGNGGNKSTIVAANVMCTNGVVHVIDRVLLPQ